MLAAPGRIAQAQLRLDNPAITGDVTTIIQEMVMNESYRILPTDHIANPSVQNYPHSNIVGCTDLNSPCKEVLIDFRQTLPGLLASNVSIDAGLKFMRSRGITEVIVSDEHLADLRGLISVRDILGRKSIRFAEQNRIRRNDIAVGDLMEPIRHLHKVRYNQLSERKVGDIVRTLRNLREKYLFITARSESTESFLGYFSLGYIASQMNTRLDTFSRARSFAELEHVLHKH